VKQCKLDLLGLLGLPNYSQDPVLKKIQDFIRRVARRVVLDMHRAGLEDDLAVMWWREGGDVSKRAIADQVWYMLSGPCCTSHAFCGDVLSDSVRVLGFDGHMIHREDIDLGWILVGGDYISMPSPELNGTLQEACSVLKRL
jgi:hypothetical protein